MNGKINRNFIIFGGTGDLTYRKLLPALYNLYFERKIANDDRIIIIGRRNYSYDEYIGIVKSWVEKYSRKEYTADIFNKFIQMIVYHQMDFQNLEEYHTFSEFFCENPTNQNIFYYAVAPMFFDVITEGVSLLKCSGQVKLIVEKPFGETLEEAEQLNTKMINYFGEENVFRIDHYLGKEMVQSVQTIRFSNLLFKNNWDKESIQKVEIIAYEEVGVETRAAYYDKVGALKDMVQNHLMQILSLIAMEKPNDEYPIKIRQQQVFESLRPIEKVDINQALVLAQYQGYIQEPGVDPNSKTETYALCKLFVDNDRWQDVPFYIKTGKRMDSREMNIMITFKTVDDNIEPECLTFKIQPEEGVKLEFNIKRPGNTDEVIRAGMDFCQSCDLIHRLNTPEAYERLLNAAVQGDGSLFATWEQIHTSWNYIQELKQKYIDNNEQLYLYPQGSTNIENFI